MNIEKTGMAWLGTVTGTTRIPEADMIQRADVDCGAGGKWAGVVKIDMRPGTKVVVFLHDSVVPEHEATEFMRSRGWIVRMQRLRGCPSEVLIMDASTFGLDGPIGTDVTERLGVLKYEKDIPSCLNGEVVGYMPGYIPKTDEINFQQAADLRAALIGQPYYATVKYDGSSQTFFHRDGEFGGCGRQWQYVEGSMATWVLAEQYVLKEKLPTIGDVALQWECVGPGVQKNPLQLKTVQPRLFDVYDIDVKEYYGLTALQNVSTELNLPMAEIVYSGIYEDFTDDQLREMARGKYTGTTKDREGIVIRSVVPMRVLGKRVSFKVINLDYKG